MTYGFRLPYRRVTPNVGLQTNYIDFFTEATDVLGGFRDRPASFSKEKMIDINEYALSENDGILQDKFGNRIVKTFVGIDDPDNQGFINIEIDRVDWNADTNFGGTHLVDTNSSCICNMVGSKVVCTDLTGDPIGKFYCLKSSYKGHNDADYFDNQLDMSALAKIGMCPLLRQNNLLGMQSSDMLKNMYQISGMVMACVDVNDLDLGTRDNTDPIICD